MKLQDIIDINVLKLIDFKVLYGREERGKYCKNIIKNIPKIIKVSYPGDSAPYRKWFYVGKYNTGWDGKRLSSEEVVKRISEKQSCYRDHKMIYEFLRSTKDGKNIYKLHWKSEDETI